MAQYPIPQFIEKEGKIISFLTFRQFFWLIGGGGLCILLYFIFPFFLFAISSLIIIAVVAMGAFFKVNNMSLVEFLFNFVKFSAGAKNYTWTKKESSYPFKNDVPQKKIERAPELPALKLQNSKLKEIKKLVETKK